MLKKLIIPILRHRHFWRQGGFDELSELYISMLFRGLAISLSGLFVPVYMHRLGYSVTGIFMVFAWYFTARVLLDFVSAHTVARIGPKHTLLIGFILQILSAGTYLTLHLVGWPIMLLGVLWGASASFFFIPFQVAFSKVKHKKHGGKELGYINIMEKFGAALGPLVGGLIATVFGAQYTFLAAVILLFAGAIPLFTSAEPVKIRQKLTYRLLPLEKIKRDIAAYAILGVENSLCICLWPLYLGLFVLITPAVYAKLGILASVSVMVAMVAAYIVGHRIDRGEGRYLLRLNAGFNAMLHVMRPFVTTYLMAFAVSMTNEAVTAGYRMPFQKGMYDAADDLPGLRIVYISSLEALASVVKGTVWWLLVIISTVTSPFTIITIGFLVAAAASLLVMTERFKSLNPPAEAAGQL